MSETRLSEQQLNYCNTFGYLYFPGLMADCIDRIIEEFEAVWAAHGGGHYGTIHEGQARSCIVPFPDQSEYLSSLLDDPRIHDIAASILGDDFNYTSGDGQFLRRRYALAFGWVQQRAHSQHQNRFLPRSANPRHGRGARHSG